MTSLPDVLFKESTWAVVEESVLWLYCEVNSTASSLVVAWSKDGDRLVQDVPHIRMRRSTSGSTTILLLVVDIFLESDVGTYRCTAQDGQDTASGTSLNLTGLIIMHVLAIIIIQSDSALLLPDSYQHQCIATTTTTTTHYSLQSGTESQAL